MLNPFSMGSASAAVLSVSHKIYIKATVLPAQTIVLNDKGQIEEIISNSEAPGQLAVFKTTVSQSSRQTIDDEVLSQYRAIMAGHTLKIGLVYSLPDNNTARPTVSNLAI
jgi:hypothetical protein